MNNIFTVLNMAGAAKNVLFLCTGNSARGLLAEALLAVKGNGLFQAYSAGIHPGALINPFAAELIQHLGYSLSNMRSKRWNEFASENSVPLDYVITLCRNTALMEHPAWPGNPIIGKWDIEDPTAVLGSIEEKRAVFKRAYDQLEKRIEQFISMPHHPGDRDSMCRKISSLTGFSGMPQSTS